MRQRCCAIESRVVRSFKSLLAPRFYGCSLLYRHTSIKIYERALKSTDVCCGTKGLEGKFVTLGNNQKPANPIEMDQSKFKSFQTQIEQTAAASRMALFPFTHMASNIQHVDKVRLDPSFDTLVQCE
ncbi:hypothetical protein GHT06_014646 [Daphnia sinensis]|uniref:Uncharacterized protein n=1 Tax=Daphnia sinensis TaxID=1820382 RepID=A0AAD5PVE8_9CRUS|nr:hypothetical protein GHT06_014646 [Daphnia sinensis]